MSEITQIIKRLRARGISQSEISRNTQIQQCKISRWESGAVAKAAEDVLALQAYELRVKLAQAHASPVQAATQTVAHGVA